MSACTLPEATSKIRSPLPSVNAISDPEGDHAGYSSLPTAGTWMGPGAPLGSTVRMTALPEPWPREYAMVPAGSSEMPTLPYFLTRSGLDEPLDRRNVRPFPTNARRPMGSRWTGGAGTCASE